LRSHNQRPVESSVSGRNESNLSLTIRGGSSASMGGGRSGTRTSEGSRRIGRGRDKVERLREVRLESLQAFSVDRRSILT
jgi:hypothetical protein